MTQGHDPVTPGAGHGAVYSPTARMLHWITVAAVFVMIPLGFAMSYRGNTLDIWDGVTDALYSTHKLTGFLVLWLSAGRLIYRLVHGAPPDEPTLEWWQKAASHLVHWALYGLLLIVPLLGAGCAERGGGQARALHPWLACHPAGYLGLRAYRRGAVPLFHPQGWRAAPDAAGAEVGLTTPLAPPSPR